MEEWTYLKYPKSGGENHLHQLGHMNHIVEKIPQKQNEKNLLNFTSLFNHNQNVVSFTQIVVGDEKGI